MEPDSVSGTEGQVRSQQGLTVTPGDEMKQFRRDKKKKMPTFFAKHRLEPPGSPGYSQTKTWVSGLAFRATSLASRRDGPVNGNAPFPAPRCRSVHALALHSAFPWTSEPFARWSPLPGPPVVTPEEALIACQIKVSYLIKENQIIGFQQDINWTVIAR